MKMKRIAAFLLAFALVLVSLPYVRSHTYAEEMVDQQSGGSADDQGGTGSSDGQHLQLYLERKPLPSEVGRETNAVVASASLHYEFTEKDGDPNNIILGDNATTNEAGNVSIDISSLGKKKYNLCMRAAKETPLGFWVCSETQEVDLATDLQAVQPMVLKHEFWLTFTVSGGEFEYDPAGNHVTTEVEEDFYKHKYSLQYSKDNMSWETTHPECGANTTSTIYVRAVRDHYPSITKQANITVGKPARWVVTADEHGEGSSDFQKTLYIDQSYLVGYDVNHPENNTDRTNPIADVMKAVTDEEFEVTYSSSGSVVSVDENTGNLSLLKEGTETISVKIAETDDYKEVSFTFVVEVKNVGFKEHYLLVPWKQGNEETVVELNYAKTGDGKPNYTFSDDSAFKYNNEGRLVVTKAGRYTITATDAGVTDTCEVLAVKFRYIVGASTGRKTLKMYNGDDSDKIDLYYGLDTMKIVLPDTGDDISDVKFEIVGGDAIVETDSEGKTGVFTFKSKGVGSFQINTTVKDAVKGYEKTFTSWFDMKAKDYTNGLVYSGVDSSETWKTKGVTVFASDKNNNKIGYDDALDATFEEDVTYVPGTEHSDTVYVRWSDSTQTYISSGVKLDTTAPSVDEKPNIDDITWGTPTLLSGCGGVYIISDANLLSSVELWIGLHALDEGGSGIAYAKLTYTDLLDKTPKTLEFTKGDKNYFISRITEPIDCVLEIEVYDNAGNKISMQSEKTIAVVDDSTPAIYQTDIKLVGDIDTEKPAEDQICYKAGTKLEISATDSDSGIVKLEYQLDGEDEDKWIEVPDFEPDVNTRGRVTATVNVNGKAFTTVYVRATNYFGQDDKGNRTFDKSVYVGTPEDVSNLSLDFKEYQKYYMDQMALVLSGDNLGEITVISSDPASKVNFEKFAIKDYSTHAITGYSIVVKDNVKDSLTFFVTGQKEPIEVKLEDKDRPFTLETQDGAGSVDILNVTTPVNTIGGITYFKNGAELRISGTTPFSGIAELKYGFSNGEVHTVEKDDITYEDGQYSVVIKLQDDEESKVSVTMTTNSGHVVSKTSGTYITDSIAPDIKVTFDNNDDHDPNYYSAGRKATIKVLEKNFHSDSLILRSRADENDIIATFKDSDFIEKTESDGKWYIATYPFDKEESYDFIVAYTDYSGNKTEYDAVAGFVIDKTSPAVTVLVNGSTNNTFVNGKAEIVIQVSDKNFDPESFVYKLASAKDAKGNSITVTPKDADGNELDPSLKDIVWTVTGEDKDLGPVNTCHFYYDVDAQYVFDVRATDKAGNIKDCHQEFFIDTKAPAGADLILPKEVRKDTINGIDYRFYDGQIEVGIKSSDATSGITSIRYECINQSNNLVFQSKPFYPETAYTATGIARKDNVLSNETVSVSFKIEKNFRGFVKIYVTDRSGNEYVKQENLVVVVDTVKPVIKVEYDNNDVKNGKYYSADRTALISVTEANYFAEDNGAEPRILNIKVSKTDSTTGKKTEEYLTAPLNAVAEQPGLYQCSYNFSNDAAYTLSIDYADRSGNKAEDYQSPEFVVDKTAPKIHVSFDNNSAKNKDQFKAIRKATIVIEENNFDPSKVSVTITSFGAALAEYQAYLNNPSNWTHENNAFIANIVFEKEGHYTFGISCRDLAENGNAGVDCGDSVAPDKFTIDTTAPNNLTMTVGDTSVRGSMETVAFERFYQSAITVKLSANCDISGLESLQYQKVDNAMAYSVNNAWTDYNDATGIVIAPSEKCIIYFKAEDRAGNVSIIRSVGMVIDNKEPTGEVEAPEIDILPDAANARGYHNSDVNVALKVLDPGYTGNTASSQGYFSGLKSITYRIYASDLDTVESGVLLDLEGKKVDGAVINGDGLISTWTGTIRVDAAKFNSNDVIVEINAVDNSGNVRTSRNRADIKIDITKPVASVSYDNNVAYYDHYFNKDRVATIVVTERNFDPALFHLALTNTAGEVPALSAWEKVNGTGNGDDTKWISKLVFTKDGDYTFEFSFADAADNACSNISFGDSACPNAFTMDQTRPVISVDFDNKDALHENYYKKGRKATITVVEHNFDPKLITVSQSAVQDEQEVAVPELSEWTSKGDTHTATLEYTEDAYYVLTLGALDKANNTAESDISQAFFVDKVAPEIRITGIEADGAYNGAVQPAIECDDVNFDPQSVQIEIERSLGTSVPFVANTSEIRHGVRTTYENVPSAEENDDIYSVKVTVTDMAGNQSVSEMKFSINRFGSTYSMDEALSSLLGTYISNPSDIVLKEVNPDELSDIRVTIFKNNETIVLNENTDYTVNVAEVKGTWKEYTFQIKGSVFQDDGVYRVSVHSVDKAGNVSENTMETKNTAISFGVDKTLPRIVVTNVENGKTYPLDNLPVEMTVNDNLQLASVKVYLDGEDNLLKEWTADEIRNMENNRSDYNFDISGESKQSHRLLVVAVDSAGNEQREEITGFYVTKDIFIRFVNNKPLFYGSISLAVVLLVGGLGLGIFFKKKKNRY